MTEWRTRTGRTRRAVLGASLALPAVASARLAAAQTAAPKRVTGQVVGAPGVNIRSCARTTCPVRTVVKLGEELTVTGERVDNYFPVEKGNVVGFAFDLYVMTPDHVPELVQGQQGCKRVGLIFNLGVGYPMQLGPLKALQAKGIAASVFPMGWWAKVPENAAALKQIDQMGFLIGSHGNDRKELTGLSDDAVRADIATAAEVITSVIGKPPQPFMTPYAAASDDRVLGLIGKAGFLPVGFRVPAADWDFDADPNEIFMKVVPNVTDGDLIEFHLDAPATPQATAVALPWVVDRLLEKGYTFVTVADMAQPCAPAGAPPATPAA